MLLRLPLLIVLRLLSWDWLTRLRLLRLKLSLSTSLVLLLLLLLLSCLLPLVYILNLIDYWQPWGRWRIGGLPRVIFYEGNFVSVGAESKTS